jgi:hypothetical protein
VQLSSSFSTIDESSGNCSRSFFWFVELFFSLLENYWYLYASFCFFKRTGNIVLSTKVIFINKSECKFLMRSIFWKFTKTSLQNLLFFFL